MIQANQLRIGNWVNIYHNHEDFEAIAIDYEDLGNIAKDNGDYSAIHLSPEVLEKCGFETINGYFTFMNGRYVIIPMRNAYTIFLNKIESAPDKMELITGFNFLHQFQNLYFALTRTELPITL